MSRIISKLIYVEMDVLIVVSFGIRMFFVIYFIISLILMLIVGIVIFLKFCKILFNMMISEFRKIVGINNCKMNVLFGVWKSIWFSGCIIIMSLIVFVFVKINVILIVNKMECFSFFC